ncbi:unnamed protein product [Moneuplotes crassus]|uniref:Uncharacterized protein n=1 Tax=Euplotes crassus TaxID=5936 RepID=A0AAD1UC09_EUPCR|nr:unnamed protein product [Moneuplotes crassus]
MEDERIEKIRNIYQRTKDIGRQITQEREKSYQLSDSSEDDYPEGIENRRPDKSNKHIRDWDDHDMNMDKIDRSTDEEGLHFEDLKQSLLEKDTQLLKVRSKNENILNQYKEAHEELEQCHEQIARQASIIHEQNYKLEEASKRIHDASHSHSQLMQRSKINVTSFQNELEQKEEEVVRLRDQLNISEERARAACVEIQQDKERIEDLAKEIKYKEEEISRMKHKCEQHEAKIDELMVNKKSDSTHLIEMDYLKEDKRRLLAMLKSTKEFKEFAEFADDSGGNLRFLQAEEPDIAPSKKKRGTSAKQMYSPGSRISPENEKENWIPEEAYQLAHEVRYQTSGEISPQLMNKLLTSLNKIWRIREKQNELRIKSKYTSEIEKLKRERNMKGQYDGVQAKKSLARTRAQLKKAEEKLRQYTEKLKKTKNLPSGMDVIDEALMIVAASQEEKRKLMEENDNLRNQVYELEEVKKNNDYEKTKFMEGANWMCTKVIKEKEKYDERDLELFKEFDHRVIGCEHDPSLAIRTVKWLKEALEVSGLEFDEVLGSLQDSAQYNMEEAMRRVQKVFSDFEPNILSLSQDTTPVPQSSISKSLA